MMAFGKELYQQIQEEKSYLFRKLIKDADARVKVTTESKVSKTSCVEVPETIETEARTLIYSESPVCSITEAKSSADGTLVSVEGTVTKVSLNWITLNFSFFKALFVVSTYSGGKYLAFSC